MLGKGLESLIPKKGNQNDGSDGAGIQPVFLSVGDFLGTSVNPGQIDPADELPAPPQELELPAEPEKEELPVSPKEEELMMAQEEKELTSQSQDTSALKNQLQNVAAFQSPAPERVIQSFPNRPVVTKPKRKEEKEQESIFHIEVDKIAPNPGQPRRNFDEDALRELASSIREFGFIQPLVVTKKEIETPTGIDVSYELIAGERRLNAAKLLGLQLVPAIVRNVSLEREKLELAVIENIQRENLNPIETARAFQRLQEEFRMTQREIAAKLGKSREAVANNVRLLDLPVYIQQALQEGRLSESHGRLLLAIDDPAAQKALFDDITEQRLTTRDVKERVKIITHRPSTGSTGGDLTPELRAMQDHLSAALGAPVEIHQGTANGKITITFYSEEELGNILRRLGNE